MNEAAVTSPRCPSCGSVAVRKSGTYQRRGGDRVQILICKGCGRSFGSDKKSSSEGVPSLHIVLARPLYQSFLQMFSAGRESYMGLDDFAREIIEARIAEFRARNIECSGALQQDGGARLARGPRDDRSTYGTERCRYIGEDTKRQIRILSAEHGLGAATLGRRFSLHAKTIRQILREARERKE